MSRFRKRRRVRKTKQRQCHQFQRQQLMIGKNRMSSGLRLIHVADGWEFLVARTGDSANFTGRDGLDGTSIPLPRFISVSRLGCSNLSERDVLNKTRLRIRISTCVRIPEFNGCCEALLVMWRMLPITIESVSALRFWWRRAPQTFDERLPG